MTLQPDSAARYREAAAEILLRCDRLATFTQTPGKVDRRYLTAEHRACNEQVQAWMQQAGLHTWTDAAGNICGSLRSANPDAPVLLIGSHLDSVPDAGKYDGILGVLLPLAGLALLQNGTSLPFHVDLIGFADEEGSRFGATLLGSRAVAGSWQDSWFALQDAEGITLQDALGAFGSDAANIVEASRAADKLLGYFEVHIEQGPVLEAADLPVGVVTAIAGARRFVMDITGQAGHAGTVPMELRKDALVVAARLVLLVEQLARTFGVVATCGRIECLPGAVNVIPGQCRLTLDIRSGDDALRDAALTEISKQAGEVAASAGCGFTLTETHNAGAVACAQWWQELCAEAIKNSGFEALSLLSGAGHDAMSFEGVCDVGMLFVRCTGGISHHPDEAVTQEDVAIALQTFCELLLLLRDQPRRTSAAAAA